MFVLINGAFGVGKTAVARELRARLPGSVIFDPELIGMALQRIPGRRHTDFQDMPSWRRLTVWTARSVSSFKPIVIIPMAFSNAAYLDELRAGLAGSGRPVLHFCLTAPLSVVRARLMARGEPEEDPRWSWVHRRAAECCAAHESPAFATHVATEGRTPQMVAADLAARIR